MFQDLLTFKNIPFNPLQVCKEFSVSNQRLLFLKRVKVSPCLKFKLHHRDMEEGPSEPWGRVGDPFIDFGSNRR